MNRPIAFLPLVLIAFRDGGSWDTRGEGRATLIRRRRQSLKCRRPLMTPLRAATRAFGYGANLTIVVQVTADGGRGARCRAGFSAIYDRRCSIVGPDFRHVALRVRSPGSLAHRVISYS